MAQPYLHDHITCLRAPVTWLSPVDGQLTAESGAVDGLYVADRRVLSRLEVRIDGRAPVPLRATTRGAGEAYFVGVVRGLGDAGADPSVWLERTRQAGSTGGTETLTLHNASRVSIEATVTVAVAADLATIATIKGGDSVAPVTPHRHGDQLRWHAPDGLAVTLVAEPTPTLADGLLSWQVTVAPGDCWSARLTVTSTLPPSIGFRPTPAATPASWLAAPLTVRADDRRLDALVAAGVTDLDALRLADPEAPTDNYPAAGSPWYLTLFARDALWTSLFALPLGVELAAGTLRTLARRQGRRVDPVTEEAPGKIPHELRSVDATGWLPPTYYGAVDATPLFVVVLARAWRWGMAPAEVAELLPAARRALEWLASHGDSRSPGFVAYLPNGAGLVNQGWKDSTNGVQHADGRLAVPPIALAEVQAYAYQAARDAADLFDAFGEPGGEHWRAWAHQLADRFRAAFWMSDVDGKYPAIALAAGSSPVDGPASNMGHLLGTGLLDHHEETLVAHRLAGPALNSGYGLRTLATTAVGFNPLSYHAGSVWPHDTAIAVLGLARSGHPDAAAALLKGLLDAAPAFDYRLPELYAGFAATQGRPVPYPAACRPQAWTAAVGPALVQALLGLSVEVPARRVWLRPIAPSPVGGYEVRDIRLGQVGTLAVRVNEAGQVVWVDVPPGFAVEVGAPAAQVVRQRVPATQTAAPAVG